LRRKSGHASAYPSLAGQTKKFPVSLNVGSQNADTAPVAPSLSTLNPKRHPHATGRASETVVETVERNALRQPNGVALADNTCALTYAQLKVCVDEFAAKLRHLGVQHGSRVGIALEPAVEAVVVVLAVHALGAAYVALDASQPAARLVGMINDAEVSFVLSTNGPLPHLVDSPIVQVNANDLFFGWSKDLETAPNFDTIATTENPDTLETSEARETREVDTDATVGELSDPAYVIFTSGSTGRPKGVAITHANLDALMHAWDRVMGSARHTSLLLSTLTFDASVAELFWPLHAGGTLIVASKADGQPGGSGLGNLIRRHNIDHLQCTPTRATLLLSDPCDRAALAHIKHLVIGGEALTRTLARRLLDAGIERITNAYGPTEATVWAFTREVTAELPSEIVGIGHPLDGISWAVVDAEGREVTEIDVLGELVLGGPFVASGYVHQDELTKAKFFSRTYGNPTSPALHSYRTGDLVARHADGSLAFHGRSDEQVKVRGFRVELGEIEAALMTHPRVRQGVVCAHWRDEANELVAFVVASPDTSNPLSAKELHDYLALLLPSAFVPSHIVLVDELPLTTSNKVDRVRVRAEMLEPLYAQPATRHAPTVAQDSLQDGSTQSSQALVGEHRFSIAAMVKDFSAALGAGSHYSEPVHEDTDFFAAGGHSMFAVALLARIQSRTGVCLPIRSLLGAPTPSQLSLVVQNELSTPASFDPLVRFQLSSASRRLYLVHGAGGNVLRYRNLAAALHDVVEVIGVQAIGVEPGNTPDHTLTAMVDRYTAALLDTNENTFELGGYSDGGVVALHIAHRLRAAGKQVRSLTLLDAFVPEPAPKTWRNQLANIGFSFRNKDSLSLGQWIRGAIVGWQKRGVWDCEGARALRNMGYVDIYAINEHAVHSEPLPETFSAPTLVVRTFEESPTKRRDYAIGFSPKRATVAWVHGPHDELLKPASIAELEAAVRPFLLHV
jgi:amino acid adenylation domain-containing protein